MCSGGATGAIRGNRAWTLACGPVPWWANSSSTRMACGGDSAPSGPCWIGSGGSLHPVLGRARHLKRVARTQREGMDSTLFHDLGHEIAMGPLPL